LKKLNNADITAKCVEISKCLLNTEVGFQDYDLDTTRTVGDIARFAANIRQAGTLEEETLVAIGVALKIDYKDIRNDILPTMEDLEWISTYGAGRKIQKIDEYIPPLDTVLDELGEYWQGNDLTNIDIASVNSVAYLSEKPATKDAVMSELDIDTNSLESTLNYGEQTSYLGTFYSENLGEEVVWTPFYWADKTDDVVKFLAKQSYDSLDRIGEVTKEIKQYPGRPLDMIQGEKKTLVEAGIGQGYFPSVSVQKEGNALEYIFPAAAQFGAKPENDIFEKARLIVGCIRHGQYHADVTKIKYPLSILRILRANQLKPHSYALNQYSPLIINRICTYEEVSTRFGTGYKINFIDTPENNIAADIAEKMLSGNNSIYSITEPEVDELLVKGKFEYTSHVRQIKNKMNIAAKDEFSRLMETMRGGIFH
jgi:hypothetical protein